MKILLLLSLSLSIFAQSDIDKFNNRYTAFFYWIGQEKTLADTSDIKINELDDYKKLPQIALDDILNTRNEWEVYQVMNFDNYDNRIAATKEFVQVTQEGQTKHMVTGGYYFIKKVIDGAERRAILQVYESSYSKKSYVHIYHRDDEQMVAESLHKMIMEYQVERNIYRSGVLDSEASPYGGRVYHFLTNVHEYDNSWQDLILDSELKKHTYFTTEGFILNNAKLDEIGVAQKRGVILYGPPGTGKSFVGQVLISSMLKGSLKDKSTMFVISARHLRDITTVSQLFRLARSLSTSAIFMEDIDLLAIKSRNVNSSQGNARNKRILNEFLNAMDGVQGNEGVLVIGTTNRAKDLDGALTRSGRLGVHIYFGLPNYVERKVFFERFATARTNWDADLTLEWLAGKTEGLSGADIIELIGIAKQDSFLMGDMTGDLINLNKAYFAAAIEKVRHTNRDNGHKKSRRGNYVMKRSYSNSLNFLRSLF